MTFPLPLGAWDGLRYFIVALPEPSILLFSDHLPGEKLITGFTLCTRCYLFISASSRGVSSGFPSRSDTNWAVQKH